MKVFMRNSYYCEKLEKTLHFQYDIIRFCCSCAEGPGVDFSETSHNFDFSFIKKQRDFYISELKKGKIPKACSGCIELKKRKEKTNFFKEFFSKNPDHKIKHIIVNHYKQCDCSCIYCSQKLLFNEKQQNYELLPIIKNLYINKILDEDNLKVEFQGGNISVLKEFEDLANEFYSHNCRDFVVLTNAIKYLPILEKICNNEKSHICISLDSGTRETFKIIKGVDKFDETIENIKKISKNISTYTSYKYIIIQNINDNIDELKAFLSIIKSLEKRSLVILEIDYRNTLLSNGVKFDVPKHYYELFEYAQKYCSENNLDYIVYPFTQEILNKGCFGS